jgi:ribonuclease HI
MINAYTDGACRISNPGLCASAFVVYEDKVLIHKQGRVLEGIHSNNVAEHTALLDFLRWAEQKELKHVNIYSDSTVVCNQVNQLWKCKTLDLQKMSNVSYGLIVRGWHTLKHCKGHAGIEGNEEADELCNVLLDRVKNEAS